MGVPQGVGSYDRPVPIDSTLGSESFCYLMTVGRRTGRPREIEIWFALEGETLYMLSGGRDRSNWVRNLIQEPSVSVRIGTETFPGRARVVPPDSEEDALARRLLIDKYARADELDRWGREALAVAVDLAAD
jgi:deazaflavin-dependent oxidoreductase (nitroreductase family)